MKDLTLDLNQRQHMWIIVGAQEGRAADLAIYLRLMEKLKLSETEETLIGVTVDGQGNMAWRMQPEGVPLTTVSVEDKDAERLKLVLENWPRFRPVDNEWLQKVLLQF